MPLNPAARKTKSSQHAIARHIAGEFDGKLLRSLTLRLLADRKYLRVAAVYRLLRRKRIGKARAMELLAQRHTAKEMKTLNATVELWRSFPIPDMLA